MTTFRKYVLYSLCALLHSTGNIFYMMEYREIFLTLLRKFDERTQPRSFLRDLVESTHLFLRMLERFCKGRNNLMVQVRVASVEVRLSDRSSWYQSLLLLNIDITVILYIYEKNINRCYCCILLSSTSETSSVFSIPFVEAILYMCSLYDTLFCRGSWTEKKG